jgi:hypothetical protein
MMQALIAACTMPAMTKRSGAALACLMWAVACSGDDEPAEMVPVAGGGGGGGAAGTSAGTAGTAGGGDGAPTIDSGVSGAGGGGTGGAIDDAGPLDAAADAADDAGSDAGAALATCSGGDDPPATWQEHWFEHEQLLTRTYFDDCVAVYFDDDVNRDDAEWLFDYMSRIWAYSLATYGPMGDGRLYAIFHQGRYGGGHPSYWYDDSHDQRNVADQGGGDWREGNYDLASHEVAHIVESTAPYPRRTSPAFGLWHDSKWAEIYQYDLYLGLGMTEHAEVVFERFTDTTDDFPRAGTRWFRDWFYPLWRDYGGAKVMTRFFALLEEHGVEGSMNWGEYVHFTSGAAGTDVKALATAAFGWPADWEDEWQAARAEYPAVVY